MRREVRDAHKLKRVMRLDKTSRYSIMCEQNKEINNDLSRQLEKFKSNLNRGKKIDKDKDSK